MKRYEEEARLDNDEVRQTMQRAVSNMDEKMSRLSNFYFGREIMDEKISSYCTTFLRASDKLCKELSPIRMKKFHIRSLFPGGKSEG